MDLALAIRHALHRRSALPALMFGGLLASHAALADTPVVTSYTYDAGNHVTSVTDPRGLVTSYTRDGLGQLWQQVSPDTGTTTYSYDSYGRRSSKTDPVVTTSYAYDGINRLVSVSAGGQTQTLSYDSCTNGVGRLCSVADSGGTTSYSYTPQGWISGRGFSLGGTTYALGYSYNALGQPTAVVYPDGNQATYTYSYGVVAGITLTVGGSNVTGASGVTYRPMDAGMTGWTSSNGLATTLSYDTDNRLTGISVPNIESLAFSYDTANRITGISNGINGTQSQNFGYDNESRLVSVYGSADNESYSYDANGNRLGQTVNGSVQSATYGSASNQLTNTSGSGAVSYAYDGRGNLTTVDSVAAFQYNPFNRLVQAGSSTYYVNPEGQRLEKTVSGAATYFAPDKSGSLLAEDDNGVWVDYLWLNGRLIGRISQGQVQAIHADQLGRPATVTNASQAVVWQAQNLAFTRNVTASNGITLNLGFPGQYYDAESGLWNNGFRDYDALMGRYIESDPIGLQGGVNTYTYVEGNPLSYFDILGLCEGIGWHVRGLLVLDPSVNASGLAAMGGGLSATKNIYGGDPDNISIATPALGLTASADVTLISVVYQGSATQSPININLGGTFDFHEILGGSVTIGYQPPATFEFQATAGVGAGAGFKAFQVGQDIKN